VSPRGFVDVDKLADNILSKSGTPRRPNGFAVDVEGILTMYCHFDVAHIPRLSLGGVSLSGAIVPERMVVLVEATEPDRRKRFTMAHELGHAEIDYHSMAGGPGLFEPSGIRSYRCLPTDVQDLNPDNTAARREMLANKFAACILMPRGLARSLWRETHDVTKCADLLEVSREAAGYRLNELKLL
jgi:Zn-dependent peptidase ImmA (M78 family)